LIGVDDDKSSSGIGEEDVYNGKKEEPMLPCSQNCTSNLTLSL